ncbi:hypothetical protein [Mycobacterium sp. 1423905.2]|uniref:hypothetical protein n=1 Tax=Mycobacterium sp. 1423905.2 TaxID=1856859 RepID=UPI0007FEA751|nr:hypothetical protein [Mycobacterium sp. 1423905.2]OBJ49268.1 hypothetical protein A9W95_02485 [Mycobacterium sp. 1423905.2]
MSTGPRNVTGIVLLVLLAAGLTFVGVHGGRQHGSTSQPSGAQPSSSATPPSVFAIPGCYTPSFPPFARPIRLKVVGCASTAVALQDMSWSSWGPQGADGTGVANFKICDPNCARGYELTKPVVVHAWNPQPPRPDSGCSAGLQIFGDMILAFPQGPPPDSGQPLNAQYNGMPAVHYVNYSVTNAPDRRFIGYTFCN